MLEGNGCNHWVLCDMLLMLWSVINWKKKRSRDWNSFWIDFSVDHSSKFTKQVLEFYTYYLEQLSMITRIWRIAWRPWLQIKIIKNWKRDKHGFFYKFYGNFIRQFLEPFLQLYLTLGCVTWPLFKDWFTRKQNI